MENNNIIKCPVCRTNLTYNILKSYVFNIKTFILYYINFIIFIICNVFIYNISLNYKYYNYNNNYNNNNNNNKTNYPINNNIQSNVFNYYNVLDDNNKNDDIFLIDDSQSLDIRISNSNYNICSNSIIYKKNIYFLLTNLCINILFPLIMGINNSISLYKYQNDNESSKTNIVMMYILTTINMINITILCIIKYNIENLKILLTLNALLYGILFFIFILFYFFTYANLFHKYVKNKNMVENIKYNIVTKLFLNTIQSTNV